MKEGGDGEGSEGGDVLVDLAIGERAVDVALHPIVDL